MIQRIQTLYLTLASVFYFCYWFFGLNWYHSGFEILKENLNNDFVINSPILELILNTTSYIPLIILLFVLFRYSLQIQSKTNFYL